MKKLMVTMAVFSCFILMQTHLFAQVQKDIRTYSKVKTVNFKELDNAEDPMAFMTNIHRPMVDQINKKSAPATAQNELIQKQLGQAPTPTLVSTISPGPNHDGGYPYDNGIAVSSSGQVVTTTNLGVYVYDLENNLAYSAGYHAFLGSTGGKFDPQVAYDSQNNRFVVIILRSGAREFAGVDIAVSATSDPTGNWHSYFIPNSHSHTESWVDFPHLGVSGDRAYVHANIHRGNNFLESNIWDVPLAELYAGNDINVTKYTTSNSNIRFVPGAQSVYGDKLYAIDIAITNQVSLFVFQNGNMEGPYPISTVVRDVGSDFLAQGKTLYPGGDAANSYAYVKDEVIYYAQTGTYFHVKEAEPMLIFGKLMINPDNYEASTASHPVYIRDGQRNFSYVNTSYAGYTNDQGVAGTIITALYASPTEYLGTIAYHVDPEENFSNGLIVAEGRAEVDTRIGDYIQAVNNPTGQNEVWISGQYGSDSSNDAINNVNQSLYLGNIIAKIHAPQSFPTSTPTEKAVETKVFPNPAIEYFTVQFNVNEPGLYHAKLYSSNGKLAAPLTSKRLKPGLINLVFNARPFKAGIYHLVLFNEKGEKVITDKLVLK